jgi:hypothetical protein
VDSVNELDGDRAGRIDLRLLGPPAPYDFITTASQAGG